jgi:predicted ATPase
VLAVYEDVHWADPSTLELLGMVIECVRHLPVLVVVTFRPEFQPPWAGQAHVTTLTMSRLGRRQGADLVARVAGEKALPAAIVEQIVARTDGIPLFVEELTKTVLESGLLTDAGDHWELSGPLPPLAIPTTLHDSLMARLDRLAPAKEVAQIGAVIGREFSYALLGAVADRPEAQLQPALDQLVASELVFRRGTPPDVAYCFKHALVQDAAYQSLLRSKRHQLHARIAQALEVHFPEQAEAQPELLAHHCTQASFVEKAIDYWYKAGRQAMARSAMTEAIAQLRQGLGLLGDLPDGPARHRRELDLQTALGGALIAVKGYGASEVRQAYGRALQLCQRTGNTGSYFSVLRGIWNWHLLRAEIHTSHQLAKQLLGMAHDQNDPDALLASYRALGSTLMFMGNLSAANAHLEQGMTLYHSEKHRGYIMTFGEDPGVICRLYIALCTDGLGHRDKARQMMNEALAYSRQLRHPFSLAFALSISQLLHMMRGEPGPAKEKAAEAASLCSQQGFAQWSAHAVFTRGWGSFSFDERETGLAEMRQGLASWRATGAVLMTAYWLTSLAESLSAVGEYDAARASAEEALSIMHQTANRYFEPEAHRILGVAAWLSDDDEANATARLRQAIETARIQSSRLLELRAARSLAQLWRDQSKRAQARDLLAPIYGWFTEGFDTADLKEAKALLEGLS